MQHLYLEEEKKYLEKFQNTTINIETFHHKEHLLVTYVLLVDNDIENTYKNIKDGILKIINHFKIDNTKYHETLTYGWVLIVDHFMKKSNQCKSFKEFIYKNNQLLDLNIIYQYYSKELIDKEKARRSILSPDIKSI